MQRREVLQAMGAGIALAAGTGEARMAEPIQLHVDLEVDPAKEADLVKTFQTVFRPTISRQPGFVDVKLLKLRSIAVGSPSAPRWRLLISFTTEELRQKWVATEDHQRAWPQMEKNLRGAKFSAALYDVQ
ncbi:MAG: hypothetical protein NZV14_04030 [Bryobacteraceae bacterium]|nr:hypothetical protein [Bryobacteraceae bacterium]MDW8377300.1 hypothetical protein [Bryobacterales bacterium]